MKLFEKRWVAVLITAFMIFFAIGIGASKEPMPEEQTHGNTPPLSTELDTTLYTDEYATWIWDEANVLSNKQEEQICLFNANWVQRYDSLIAVAMVKSVSGDIDDYAYDLGGEIGLGNADAILVIDVKTPDAYLAVGQDYPLSDGQITTYLDRYLYEPVMSGDYGDGVLALFDGLNEYYVANYGLGNLEQNYTGYEEYDDGSFDVITTLLMLVILFVIVATLIDQARYDTYRQRYYGVASPPVVFRPILFWHGPRSSWYRRNWHQPPPPPPPRGPGGPGPNSRPGGGFSGGSRPGGSFSSGPRGGGFSSGPRGGRC